MGRFLPGHVKVGGKVKGSKNKRTNLLAMCEAKGLNLFEEALSGVALEDDPDKRFEKIIQLLPYVYARKKETVVLTDFEAEELLDAAEQVMEEDGSTPKTPKSAPVSQR